MLSRIAGSLYWIGRLVERAEDTARLLDVHVSLQLEDLAANEERMCRDVLTALGIPADSVTPATAPLLEAIAYGADSAIYGSLLAARERARTVREAISSEMWEALNTTRNALAGYRARARRGGPHDFFAFVKTRAALFAGLTDETMARDDGWYFLLLGRSLERVDMTARILSVARSSPDPQLSSVTLLRACGAFEAYLRTYRGSMATRQAIEFLLLDRLFPRSVFHALVQAEEALRAVTPAAEARTGVADHALRVLGRARTRLEFADDVTASATLPAQLADLQQACRDASSSVASRYFHEEAALRWAVGLA